MQRLPATSSTASTSRIATSLVGLSLSLSVFPLGFARLTGGPFLGTVLYHQPEKMARTEGDLQKRQENLEKLKKQHGID